MALIDNINSVLNNQTLTEIEKRLQIYGIKGNAVKNSLNTIVGTPFLLNGLTITVTKATTFDGQRLAVWVTAKRGTTDIIFPKNALPLIFINPPTMVAGAENTLAAGRQIIAEAVARYG